MFSSCKGTYAHVRGIRSYRPVHAHIHAHAQCTLRTYSCAPMHCAYMCTCTCVCACACLLTHAHTHTRTSRDPWDGRRELWEGAPPTAKPASTAGCRSGWGRESVGAAWGLLQAVGRGAGGTWTPLSREAVICPVSGCPRCCVRVSPSFSLRTFPRPRPQVLTGRGHQERVQNRGVQPWAGLTQLGLAADLVVPRPEAPPPHPHPMLQARL